MSMRVVKFTNETLSKRELLLLVNAVMSLGDFAVLNPEDLVDEIELSNTCKPVDFESIVDEIISHKIPHQIALKILAAATNNPDLMNKN